MPRHYKYILVYPVNIRVLLYACIQVPLEFKNWNGRGVSGWNRCAYVHVAYCSHHHGEQLSVEKYNWKNDFRSLSFHSLHAPFAPTSLCHIFCITWSEATIQFLYRKILSSSIICHYRHYMHVDLSMYPVGMIELVWTVAFNEIALNIT